MAARAINMPAKMPSNSICHHLRLAFCLPMVIVLSKICAGVSICTSLIVAAPVIIIVMIIARLVADVDI